MLQQIQTFGTLKYRKTRNNLDTKIGWIGLRDAHKHAYVWEHTKSVDGEALKGLGYPVFDTNGEIVNFLKMSFSGPLLFKHNYIEESFEPGLPIANCHARFGRPTNVILVTVDCLTAMVLHLSTGLGTVATLYPGNLKTISVYLRNRYPDSEFKICVNGDGSDEHSLLLFEADEAARAIGGKVFASGLTTFFDLHRKKAWPDSIQKILDGKGAVSPWNLSRGNENLKIPGSQMTWPNHIGGENLLDNLVHQIKKYVPIPAELALIAGLWTMHTYGIDKVRFSPLLAIMSPEYIDGPKSLLEVLRRVCCYAYKTSAITNGQLLKIVSEERPTLLHDDGDAFFQSQPLISILKTSFDRISGGITTTDSKGSLSAQSAFFAKATTSTGGIPEQISGLAIPILLQRNEPNEKPQDLPPFDLGANDEFCALRAQIVQWWQDHAAEVVAWQPNDLELGSVQSNNTYRTLFAIASAIGPDVLQRTVASVKKVLTQSDLKSEGVRLLEIISEILKGWREKNIHSMELTELVRNREEWQCATSRGGKVFDQTELAAMLKPYGIHPGQVRSSGANKQGYRLSDFRKAFAQYLRNDGREEEAQEPNPVIVTNCFSCQTD